ncbi:rRNA maturation RNase YbeY [Alteribacillus sp. JSM 102045]|uniref:rRNA maturation RNase YbeY n=1 Tax=Alteribacillus sp. JSM 102045 TaxID=1562101 RepID=UPI0035C23771
MEIVIDLIDETESMSKKEISWLRDILQSACEKEQVQEGSELSVTIVDNEQIHSINQQYRGVDRPTDVISFALNEDEEIADNTEVPNLLGDIVISIEKAKEQAENYGHSLERELGFLAVHGLLHLLGYTHDTAEAEKEMFSRQESILSDYGLKR